MGQITEEFKNLTNGILVDKGMFVPILKWASGTARNIEMCQRINRKFKYVESSVLIKELVLKNNLRHFIKYPKSFKNDEKLDFFYSDICSYYGWTRNEFYKNLTVLDIESLKSVISLAYGYDRKQRRALGLPLSGYNDGMKKI